MLGPTEEKGIIHTKLVFELYTEVGCISCCFCIDQLHAGMTNSVHAVCAKESYLPNLGFFIFHIICTRLAPRNSTLRDPTYRHIAKRVHTSTTRPPLAAVL